MIKQLVLTEFEMGSTAKLVDLLTKQTTKQAYSKLMTQIKGFVCSMFIIKGLPLVGFDLISVAKVTEFEYPCEISFIFYYQGK